MSHIQFCVSIKLRLRSLFVAFGPLSVLQLSIPLSSPRALRTFIRTGPFPSVRPRGAAATAAAAAAVAAAAAFAELLELLSV